MTEKGLSFLSQILLNSISHYYTLPSDFKFTRTIPPETTSQKEEKENANFDAEDSDSDQEYEVQPTPQFGFVSREEVK